MRRTLIPAAALILLAACGRASALTPDSSNPVHCFAAFNYAAYWFKVGKRADKETAMLARGLFELDRAKQAGNSDPLSEAKEFIKLHGRNDQEMDTLFLECSNAQNGNADFRAQLPELFSRAQAGLLAKF
jgi:hypothetical protein